MSVDHELLAAHAEDKQTRVTLRNIHTNTTLDRFVDHLIVEAGTLPNDDLFYALKSDSANKGVIDLDLFTEGRPQPAHGESFHLYRVGDVSGSRDIHWMEQGCSRWFRVGVGKARTQTDRGPSLPRGPGHWPAVRARSPNVIVMV